MPGQHKGGTTLLGNSLQIQGGGFINQLTTVNISGEDLTISNLIDTTNIQITNNPMLMSIVGEFNQNLKELEKITNTNIFFRGNSITCKGKESNLKDFTEAIKFLVSKYLLTKLIEKSDIMLSVKKNMKLEESNVKSFKQLIKTPRKSVIARSEKQSQ